MFARPFVRTLVRKSTFFVQCSWNIGVGLYIVLTLKPEPSSTSGSCDIKCQSFNNGFKIGYFMIASYKVGRSKVKDNITMPQNLDPNCVVQ